MGLMQEVHCNFSAIVTKGPPQVTHETLKSKTSAKGSTTDSCFSLIVPHQCSAALGGPATSTEDLRYQGS